MKKKTIIITGASSGIGKACANIFAKNSYQLVLAARNKEKLDAFANELNGFGVECIGVQTDVSKRNMER